MNLIAILLCIVLQRFLNLGGYFKNIWFYEYVHQLIFFLQKKNKWISLIVIIFPIFLVLGVLQFFLQDRLFGVFYLVILCVVLFFCIDARDFRRQLTIYFEQQEKHDESAVKKIAAKYSEIDNTYTIQEVNRAVTKAVLLKSFEKLFSGLFWFTIFSVYGVTLYFVLSLLTKKRDDIPKELTKLACQLRQIADYIPSRILGFTFAIGGCLRKGFSYCLYNLQSNYKFNEKFVIESGLIALDADLTDLTKLQERENQDALNLIDRTLIIWIVFIGLISLIFMF